MSRVGGNPIKIEEGVEVSVNGAEVIVKGKLGEIKVSVVDGISVEVKDGMVFVNRADDVIQTRANHGTFRSLIANAMFGVSNGYEKNLEIVGVGYRARLEGEKLILTLGWNHPVEVVAPEGVKFEVPDENHVNVKGFDKQFVGQVTSKIRDLRKPEPYKGKGIRYVGEQVRRKSAKSVTAE